MAAEHASPPLSSALSVDAQDDFRAASLILRRYGLNLAAASDQEAGHDVLMARTMPRADVEYKQVLADMAADGTLGPRLKTSYYRGETRIIVYESSPPRPVLEIHSKAGEGVTLTVLDPGVPLRLSMDGSTCELTETSEELQAV